MAIKASDNFKLYKNPNGPDITTVARPVIQQDGLYFKDIDGSSTVSAVNDWRLSPAERGKGHGSAILAKLQKLVGTIVLEVETPTDDISRRRIEFYKRQGFELCSTPYTQPPYCESGNSIPMFLMFRGAAPTKELFEETKKEIYSKIYSYKE